MAKKAAKPATKRRASVTKVTPKKEPPDTSWHARFLELLATSCNVTLSARGAGVERMTAYRHYELFPDFARAWDDAKDAAVEVLEAEAWQRARKQSDTLMIFLLKAHKPEKYREQFDLNVRKLSDEDLIAAVTGALAGNVAARSDASGGDPRKKR
jgi:hypothetical protein